jgi:hypothetical protein
MGSVPSCGSATAANNARVVVPMKLVESSSLGRMHFDLFSFGHDGKLS